MEFEPYKINLSFSSEPKKRLITINGVQHKLNADEYHVAENGDIITICIDQEWRLSKVAIEFS